MDCEVCAETKVFRPVRVKEVSGGQEGLPPRAGQKRWWLGRRAASLLSRPIQPNEPKIFEHNTYSYEHI